MEQPSALIANVLDYRATPEGPEDRSYLAFSDKGAWFGYGFPADTSGTLGFSGPYLLAKGQGEWISPVLTQLELVDLETDERIDFSAGIQHQRSYASHLEQMWTTDSLGVVLELIFTSPETAFTRASITNHSSQKRTLRPRWSGRLFNAGIRLEPAASQRLYLHADQESWRGEVLLFDSSDNISFTDSSYALGERFLRLAPNETKEMGASHTFSFLASSERNSVSYSSWLPGFVEEQLRHCSSAKAKELETLTARLDTVWRAPEYQHLLAKSLLTLQNNTRVPAGELKHAGLFPSYHYKWFLGFWAWDSWKHAVALSHYDPELAKDQIRAMYDYMDADGFIADCVFRDTTLEQHNLRNTKPPLSGWAVWEVYEQEGDVAFVQEMYPQLIRQHAWWYRFRDADQDGLCEYGSTDGTLIAAKWESGMDNAVRFDHSTLIQSGEGAYSLNQESVDLNAYLYAEKVYLAQLAEVLGNSEDQSAFDSEAKALKTAIQAQFFDAETGWFYDTSIDGKTFIEVRGCEGWTPLWADVATAEQAEAVMQTMLDPEHFNTHVPFPTLSASHPDFAPDGGYWRGPNWLDQVYFGIRGLHNYGYHREAYSATHKLFHNAEGLLQKGPSIRENYHPLTGTGLESHNFSWSAAHCLLLLLKE